MVIFKVYNKENNWWYRGSGNWALSESAAKNYKAQNHASASITLYLSHNKFYKHTYEDFEIVKYEIKEIDRIKYE